MRTEIDSQMFLESVLAEPDNDAARLAFADLLEEQGQPERAEFVRVQVELASIGHADWPEGDVSRRSSALLNEHGQAWAADVTGPGVHGVHFHRGFVEEVDCTTHAFITRGTRWAERAPLRSVRLSCVAGRGEQLAACAHLRRLVQLSIHDSRVGDSEVAALARSPFLGRLTSLTVEGDRTWGRGANVGALALRALAEAPFLSTLTDLAITTRGAISAPALEALVGAGSELRLKHLSVEGGAVDDRGAFALANAPGLKNLSSLALTRQRIADAGLVALLTSPHLRNLLHVYLTCDVVTEDGLAALATVTCAPALDYLSLELNLVRSVDADALAATLVRNPNLNVNLWGCPIPKPLQQELARRFQRRVHVEYEGRRKVAKIWGG